MKNNFRELRHLAGWTLCAAAQNADIDKSILSLFELGQTKLSEAAQGRLKRALLREIEKRAARIKVVLAEEISD